MKTTSTHADRPTQNHISTPPLHAAYLVGLRTRWISSELIRRLRSVLIILGWGNLDGGCKRRRGTPASDEVHVCGGEAHAHPHGQCSPVPTLLNRHSLECPVDVIQFLKGSLSPYAEPPHVATWRELEKVETVHLEQVHSGDVPEGACDAMVLIVYDQRSLAQLEAAITHLPLTSTNPPRVCLGGRGPPQKRGCWTKLISYIW